MRHLREISRRGPAVAQAPVGKRSVLTLALGWLLDFASAAIAVPIGKDDNGPAEP